MLSRVHLNFYKHHEWTADLNVDTTLLLPKGKGFHPGPVALAVRYARRREMVRVLPVPLCHEVK